MKWLHGMAEPIAESVSASSFYNPLLSIPVPDRQRITAPADQVVTYTVVYVITRNFSLCNKPETGPRARNYGCVRA